jgi:acyl-CoA thioesterase II
VANRIKDYPVEGSPDGDATRLPTLERLDRDLFRSRFSEIDRNDHLFGGQVLAQSLAAAGATVAGRTGHSLHGYFLRAGSAGQRVIFRVERTRDGGSFSTRRVVAEQNGTPIFHMECSFHQGEPGYSHQEPAPLDVPPPEAVADAATVADWMEGRAAPELAAGLRRFRLMDLRLIDHELLVNPILPARRRFWLRVPSAASTDDPLIHQQLLAYLSDYWLAGTALVPHPVRFGGPELFMASLDHALWFHRPHRADEWLLYDCDSPWAGEGRGLSRGLLFNREGNLVASVMQEVLLRRR